MNEEDDERYLPWSIGGRAAVVVGGARLLGLDMAEALARAGASVAIGSRSSDRSNEAAARLTSQFGTEAIGFEIDVTDPISIERAASRVDAWRGAPNILINNAGGGSGGDTGDFFTRPVDAVTTMIATNLTGTLLCCRAFGALMKDQRREGGSIVNVASVAGLVGRDRTMYFEAGVEQQPVDYAAAKAGVIGLTRDLAAVLAPAGIRVNSISPGGFGPRQLPAAFANEYSRRTPLGRMGRDGSDIGGTALYLASDASAYVTGQNLVVDGGFTVWR